MDEYDVNVATYKDVAQWIGPSVLEKYADLSVFEINDTDTGVELVTRDGDTISYEFEPFKK